MTNLLQRIVLGGLLCGVLDFIAATSFYAVKGVPALRVWQAVASGFWGPAAFLRGWTSGAVGLGIHFLVAFSAAAVFCLAAHQLPALAQRFLLYGPIYGIAVFLFMNFFVIPLSAMPKRPVPAEIVVAQLLIHIVCVGLPISFSASRFSD